MKLRIKTLAASIAIGLGTFAGLGAPGAMAQPAQGPVRIGFITDMSSLYADIDGPAGGEMIKMAVQDFGGKVLGRNIEVLTADHQNKADVASSKAREWIDKDGLAMLVGEGVRVHRIEAQTCRSSSLAKFPPVAALVPRDVQTDRGCSSRKLLDHAAVLQLVEHMAWLAAPWEAREPCTACADTPAWNGNTKANDLRPHDLNVNVAPG